LPTPPQNGVVGDGFFSAQKQLKGARADLRYFFLANSSPKRHRWGWIFFFHAEAIKGEVSFR